MWHLQGQYMLLNTNETESCFFFFCLTRSYFLTPSLQKNAKVVSIDSYEDVPTYDEKALQKAVANQPIAVAIEGGGREFQLYSSVSV